MSLNCNSDLMPSVLYTQIFKIHKFLRHSTVNDAWSVPSVFTPCTSSTSAKFMNTHIFREVKVDLTTWQTLFKLLPSVWVLMLSMEPRVPPRELYVLFVKYYLMTFVSKKNKCCSHWNSWLDAVYTSQKVNTCCTKNWKQNEKKMYLDK